MFSYFLSVAVTFIIFGTINNILNKVEPDWYCNCDFDEYGWWVVTVASVFWFIFIPIITVVLILYMLKLLTDLISDFIMNKIEKRKLKNGEKDV